MPPKTNTSHPPEAEAGARSFKLPPSITTAEILSSVRFEIARELEWREQAAVKALVTQKAPSRDELPPLSPEAEDVLAAWCGGRTPEEQDVRGLSEFLKTYHPVTVHLTMAALPVREQRDRLVTWFRKNCHPDTLIAFTADRTIGGGIVVRTPNRVFDLSFRQRLERGKGHIPEAVRAHVE